MEHERPIKLFYINFIKQYTSGVFELTTYNLQLTTYNLQLTTYNLTIVLWEKVISNQEKEKLPTNHSERKGLTS